MKIRRFIILSLVVFCAVQSSCAHDQAHDDDLQKISYYGGKQEKGIPREQCIMKFYRPHLDLRVVLKAGRMLLIPKCFS